jgi:alpha-beta hydrolase superfamily lysophospholipase
MTVEKFGFSSDVDALSLQGYKWSAAPDPKGTVVIAHGKGEHAGRYDEFALKLNQADYIVYSVDHRGHGGSPGPNGLGDFGDAGWNALVADLLQLVRIARHQHPKLPLTLFGHSMGSFAAQHLILQSSALIDNLVLSGSAAVDKLMEQMAAAMTDEPETGEENGENAASDFEPFNKSFSPPRTPFDWLSRDVAEVDKYIADPLCGFDFTTESTISMAMSAEPLASPELLQAIRKDLPMLLVAGDKDPVTGELLFLDILEQRYKDAGMKDIEKLYYPGGRHEMLNEINREEVIGDIIQWLDQQSGS